MLQNPTQKWYHKFFFAETQNYSNRLDAVRDKRSKEEFANVKIQTLIYYLLKGRTLRMRKGVAAVKVEKRIKIPRRGDGFDMSHNQEVFPFLVKKNSKTLAFGPMSLNIRCGGSWGGLPLRLLYDNSNNRGSFWLHQNAGKKLEIPLMSI